jgi:homoserine/homoserine lactone efflux protein
VIDPERLAAFALMTAATSVVPGVSMLFVVGRTIRHGWRSGAAGLAGMQLGYICWWLLAGLGLGTLAAAFPLGFEILAVGGVLYLAWLGLQSIRHTGLHAPIEAGPTRSSRGSFRDGVLVALSNPKSLIYIVALLPPFVDARFAVGPQLLVLAAVALMIDIIVGTAYIAAGSGLARAMADETNRRRFDRLVGALFLAIAAGILANLALG